MSFVSKYLRRPVFFGNPFSIIFSRGYVFSPSLVYFTFVNMTINLGSDFIRCIIDSPNLFSGIFR